MSLAVHRSDTHAYVQFADGDWLCFDIAADPTWRTLTTDPTVVLPLTQAMLQWRMKNSNRVLTGFLVEDGGTGRWPTNVPWRESVSD
jgi:hypothetical protein